MKKAFQVSAVGSILTNRLQCLQNNWRRFHLRLKGVEAGPSCRISPYVGVNLGWANNQPGRIVIAEHVRLSQGVILDAWGGSITLHSHVFLGPYTLVYGHGGVIIGKDSLIATHCSILSSNHTIPEPESRIRWKADLLLPTTIGEDVWLGAGVTVLGGIDIGDGCVVGAGAVVNKSLPPYSVAVGVPARIVRMRV